MVFRGPVMGGGAVTTAMKAHLAAGHAFVATESAAATFADDLDKVRALGARVVGEGAADEVLRRLPQAPPPRSPPATWTRRRSRRPARCSAWSRRSPPWPWPSRTTASRPDGSNRVLRFALWERAVDERRPLGELFYDADAVPPALTRLRARRPSAAAASPATRRRSSPTPARRRSTAPCRTASATPCSSTSATATPSACWRCDGRVAGVFEHHTACLDGAGLELRLRRCLAGDLASDEVRADDGHGAVLRPAPPAHDPLRLPLIVTGPRRELLAGGDLPAEFAAPHGDMMLTGCFGLLRALRRAARRPRRGAPS